MITMNSTVRDVYNHPVGRDILDMLLAGIGRGPGFLTNPLVGNMKLSALDKLAGSKAPGAAEMLITLLNQHPETLPPSPDGIKPKWWKEAVVYQVYPRSFMDSNGDGIGDLAGIRSRIPYLKKLGITALWLSPIYDSPNDDMGYDIRNYRKIMKEFGSMQSFDALLAELHKNGIKLIMDLVVNHTSDEHEWFQKALKDPNGPTKDYYMWAKGKAEGEPPNNWVSFFAGPTWNYYEETGEWALHLFSKKQMDLNWDNPALRAEVYEMINWWLDKGVDGFRLDVINLISKASLQDGNELVGKAIGMRGIEQYFYGPHLHEYLQEMRRESFDRHADTFTVGETPGMGLQMCRMLTAESRGELDLVFNFDHLDNPGESRLNHYEYDLRYLKDYFLKWQLNYGDDCWQSLFFENHDNPRMPSKVNSNPAYREVIAKLLAVLQLTLRGTPFIYQGQELGMSNTVFSSPDDFRDVEAKNRYEEWRLTEGDEAAFQHVAHGTRDHARTPMQWDASTNAGFTTGTPWLDINPNYVDVNAEAEQNDPDSVFCFFRDLIALRREHSALIYGDFQPVFKSDKNTFCYFRKLDNETYYIELNLTGETTARPGPLKPQQRLLCGNYGGVVEKLRPYEANVYKVN